MNLQEQDRRRHTSTVRYSCHEVAILLLLIQLMLVRPAIAQAPSTPIAADPVPLTVEQVVNRLVQMNRHRAESLQAFQGTRTYRAEYHGFGGARSAEMVVSVKYLYPTTKEFTILSTTGSKLIIDRVFKRLLAAEKEALDNDMQRRSALTEDNYRFKLVGCERGESGVLYVLDVEPRTRDKFLYRGRIWVDATDFAVVRLKAEPAKNPSFWTTKADIVQVYAKVSDFWLPAHNQSVSTIRFGGHAELTIDYEAYKITGASEVSNLPATGMALDVNTTRSRKQLDIQPRVDESQTDR